MGFCFFNNIAIAAAHARARGVDRIAIVDYDVHHGNGTQHSFYDDPNVLFISTHQYPFYPGPAPRARSVRGAGAGFTVNMPLEGGATDGDYQRVFEASSSRCCARSSPALLLVSAGFDAHERDPLAQMRVTTPGSSG